MNAYNKQYLDLVEDILNNGIEAPCRTGNKVLVTLNKSLTWDLKNGFPLLVNHSKRYCFITSSILH